MSARVLPAMGHCPEHQSAAAETLPLIDEELRVEKQSVLTGKVRIRSVHDRVEELAQATLKEERVEVTCVPIGLEVEVKPEMRTEGDVTIIPILEEIMIVETRLVLKEELHVRRVVTQEHVEVPVTLRKQRAVIERVGVGPDQRGDEETAS